MVRLSRFPGIFPLVCCCAFVLMNSSWAARAWAQDEAPANEAPAAVEQEETAPEQPPAAAAEDEASADEASNPDAPAAKAENTPAAEEAAPPVEQADPAAAERSLRQAVENFWHYGKIARYDLAAAEGKKILEFQDRPADVLSAFNQVAADRKDRRDEWLLRWQGVEQLREVTNQIIAAIQEGERAKRQEPAFIEEQIERLARGERAYQLAINRLRNSGELAVPLMLEYLRNPARQQFHVSIRRALRDLKRAALNPLVASTEMDDANVLVAVVGALGDIGYDAAVPYLARLYRSNDTPGAVRAAAGQALGRMGAGDPNSIDPGQQFYALAEKFYYDNADITADKRDSSAPANVWYWTPDGLRRKEVPQAIFNEIMAMRASEYALALGAKQDDAMSLWLAANYKREAELPEGAADPTRAENQPPAHYYGVTAGTQYLNNALARALRDNNSAVAFRVIKSLQQIVGQSNLFTGDNSAALVDAMGSGDRLVRIEAAFALAAALPVQRFNGQERVVPLLAEAISQTGTPTALVVVPSQDELNVLSDGLKSSGFAVTSATSGTSAITAAEEMPAVDVVIASEALGGPQVDEFLQLASRSVRLQNAPKVVMVATGASPLRRRAAIDQTITLTQARDAAGLLSAIEAARDRAATPPMDAAMATDYALRAGKLLSDLAISRGQALDLRAAERALLAALGDQRPEVVKVAGGALGLTDSAAAQPALLDVAANEQTGDDVKISLYNSLATSAKFFGNRLDGERVRTLEQIVQETQNLDVRAAAAEARGALNLPPEQAKTLILNQSVR